MIKIVIPIQPITKKNHQQIVQNRATGRKFVIPSSQYTKYENECSWHLKLQYKADPIECPVNVKALYYMGTRKKVDLTNLMEATHDVLVTCGVLADDNSKVICSVDGSRVLYDKASPRTEIYIDKEDSLII